MKKVKKILTYAIIVLIIFVVQLVFSVEPYNECNNVPIVIRIDCNGANFIKNETGEQIKDTFIYCTKMVTNVNAISNVKVYFEGNNEIGWSMCIYYKIGNYSLTRKNIAKIINKDMSEAEGCSSFLVNIKGGDCIVKVYEVKDLPKESY